MIRYFLPGFFLILVCYTANAQLDIPVNIDKARREIFENKNDIAIERLNKVIKLRPDLYEAFYFRGIAKFDLNDFSGAIDDFTEVIHLNPFLPDAYHYRGVAKSSLHDYNSALNDLDKAAQMDINNPGIFISRGLAKINIKNYSAAIDDFNKANFLNPTIPEILVYRAIAKSGLKDYESAIVDCNLAIGLNIYNSQAYVQKGLIKVEQKNYESAISEFNQAIKIKPGEAYTYYLRAISKLHLNDLQGTMADYDKVIELNPFNALAFYNRAMLKSEIGKTNEAILDLDRVTLLNPVHILSYYNRGIMKLELKDYSGAIDDFSKAIEIYPDFGEAYYMRSMVKRELGNIRSAERDYLIANAKLNAQNNDTLLATINANKYRKAIELEADFNNNFVGEERIYSVFSGIEPQPNYLLELSRVNEINSLFSGYIPDHFLAIDNLFLIIDNKNDSLIDYKKLSTKIDDLLLKDTKSYQMWFYKGFVSEKLQNYNTALDAYTKVLELKPDFVFAWLNRANASFEMLNFINSIDETIEIKVDNQSKNIGGNTDFIQDYSQILNDYSKAIENNPDLPFAYYNRANLKVKSKNYEGAIFDYDRAIKLEPDFADAYYNLALVLIYQKNFEKACQTLSKAGELGLQKAYLVIKKYCLN